MAKALLCGVGRMGRVIGYAMNHFGYDVVVAEPNGDAVGELEALIDKNLIRYTQPPTEQELCNANPDVVVSSMPYFENKRIAEQCIKHGIRYCDLGGRVDVSAEINELANEQATKPVFTDLGLAPGWVNILAEQGCKSVYNATDVKMMVGGIPLHRPTGPLKYFMTWSLEGLLNEYRDDCEILEDGEIKIVPGLSNYELVDPEWEGCIGLEAFCTSGGAAHTTRRMQKKGVKNCVYKTLRWVGHHELIDFFMTKCKMSDEQLNHILKASAECETHKDDVVIIMVEVKNKDGLVWKREHVIESDAKFTAMQKCTAFSIASVAALLGNGEFDDRKTQYRGYWKNEPMALTYADVPFSTFTNNINTLLNK